MASSGHVSAVIYGRPPAPLAQELVRAVAQQTVTPTVTLVSDQLLEMIATAGLGEVSFAALTSDGQEETLAAGLRTATAAGTRWIWLLDGWTVPAPEALAELLKMADASDEPAPLLVASKVLDGSGHLHPDAIPRHEIFEKERTVDATEHRLVQLRSATHGSVLVAADAVGRHGPPRSDLPNGVDMVEWSARILRRWEDSGYLVPTSVAVRRARPVARSWRHWIGRARVVGSPGWAPTERLWETFVLGEALAAAIRRPRTSR